jgi:hypothetical protein
VTEFRDIGRTGDVHSERRQMLTLVECVRNADRR